MKFNLVSMLPALVLAGTALAGSVVPWERLDKNDSVSTTWHQLL